jgi:hypothetical protein|tara:strand:- start:2258 stop:2881 length:624 start_codon:yes stop_codon:yes gene_type:complete
MSIFAEVAKTLLQAEVICKYRYSNLYEELKDEAFFRRINSWFEQIDLSIKSSSDESGYYLVTEENEQEIKARARTVFSDLMKSIRFHVSWLEHCMNVFHRDYLVTPGEQFRYSDFLDTLNNNTSLQNELGSISVCKKESKLNEQLDKLIAQLIKDGLVVEVNSRSRIYQFTGKLEVLTDYLIFIKENEQIAIEEFAGDNPKQKEIHL